MTIALDQLAAEDFETLAGTSLPARAGEAAFALTVDGVWRSPYPSSRPVPGFSLFLRGPRDVALSQGVLQLEHPVHGVLEVFITPIGRDADGLRYEAVFN